eukprot:scaffold7998_cov417-Prasinococcus_capsulatus_cf.AAC.13
MGSDQGAKKLSRGAAAHFANVALGSAGSISSCHGVSTRRLFEFAEKKPCPRLWAHGKAPNTNSQKHVPAPAQQAPRGCLAAKEMLVPSPTVISGKRARMVSFRCSHTATWPVGLKWRPSSRMSLQSP